MLPGTTVTPRNGSKIFAGEYAAQSDKTVSSLNKNNAATAIAEAAFLTGFERNAAVVNLASYEPLFAQIDGCQWTPDLIWLNNLQSYRTPKYYVQKLYSLNKGTHVAIALQDGKPLTGQDILYASAVIDKNINEVIIKIVNPSATAVDRNISLQGAKKLAGTSLLTVLKGNNKTDVSLFNQPEAIAPVESAIKVKEKQISFTAAPYSMSVIKVKM